MTFLYMVIYAPAVATVHRYLDNGEYGILEIDEDREAIIILLLEELPLPEL